MKHTFDVTAVDVLVGGGGRYFRFMQRVVCLSREGMYSTVVITKTQGAGLWLVHVRSGFGNKLHNSKNLEIWSSILMVVVSWLGPNKVVILS